VHLERGVAACAVDAGHSGEVSRRGVRGEDKMQTGLRVAGLVVLQTGEVVKRRPPRCAGGKHTIEALAGYDST
jgi:hypothetical protein